MESPSPFFPKPGAEIGGCVLEERVGEGGQASVWRARQTEADGRFVAVKILPLDGDQLDENAQRLLREIEFARHREHASLVRVFHGGRVPGCVYYVMEFIEGGHLGEFTRRERPDQKKCAGLIARVAEGVAHLHIENVIHRDLKPQNILLTPDGQPKIADFGLAKSLRDTAPIELTETGAMLGTPAYMAPEQAAGRKAGPPADVWALGVILHEMLTGSHPLEGMKLPGSPGHRVTPDGYISLLGDMLRENRSPPPLGKTAPRVDSRLSDIVGRCLEADPAARYRHVSELREDLDLFVADEPPRHARPRSLRTELLVHYRRSRAFWNLAIVAVPLLIAGLVIYAVRDTHSATRERALRMAAEEASTRERTLRMAAEEASHAALRATSTADLAREDAEIHQHASEALNMLNRSPQKALRLAVDAAERSVRRFGAPPPEVQFSLTHAIDAAREERNWRGLGSKCSAVSTDGKRFAVGDRDGRIRIIDLAQGTESRINAHNSEISAIAFSPDGTQLISAGKDKNLRCWTLAGEPVGPPWPRRANVVTAIAFAPDGKEIIAGEGNGTIVRCDLSGRMIGNPFVGHENVISSILVTEDAIVSSDMGGVRSTIRFWSKNGEPLCDPVRLESETYSIALSTDGKMIASGGSDKAIRFWTLHGEPVGTPLHGHSDDVRGVNFCSDGLHLASASMDGTVWVWNLIGRQPVKKFDAHSGGVTFTAFRAQMPTLLTGGADGICREWVLQPFEAQAAVEHGDSARFMSDGRLVTSGRDGSIWTRERSGKTVGPASNVESGAQVAFSKDARWVWSYLTYGSTITIAEIGAPARVLKFDHPVLRATVSSEHKRLIISDGDRLCIYDWEGKPIAYGAAQNQPLLEVNDPRQLFAGVGYAGEASLWDFSGKCVAKPAKGRFCRAITFSPDGRFWALGFDDGSVRVLGIPEQFDSAPNTPTADLSAAAREMPGHKAPVTALAFSADGQRIASAAADGTIRISDSFGNELTPLWAAGCTISSLSFSPDGKILVSAGEDDLARFWIADWEGWLELGRKRLTATVMELSPVRASR